jgi:hypothetical protein
VKKYEEMRKFEEIRLKKLWQNQSQIVEMSRIGEFQMAFFGEDESHVRNFTGQDEIQRRICESK